MPTRVGVPFSDPARCYLYEGISRTGHELAISGGGRRCLIGDVHHTTPLAIRLEAPDRVPTKVERDRLTLRPGHSHLVGAAHVGKLPVGRKRRLLGYPVNLEAGRLETLGDKVPNRRFALD